MTNNTVVTAVLILLGAIFGVAVWFHGYWKLHVFRRDAVKMANDPNTPPLLRQAAINEAARQQHLAMVAQQRNELHRQQQEYKDQGSNRGK